jgi:hypothetical protein
VAGFADKYGSLGHQGCRVQGETWYNTAIYPIAWSKISRKSNFRFTGFYEGRLARSTPASVADSDRPFFMPRGSGRDKDHPPGG